MNALLVGALGLPLTAGWLPGTYTCATSCPELCPAPCGTPRTPHGAAAATRSGPLRTMRSSDIAMENMLYCAVLSTLCCDCWSGLNQPEAAVAAVPPGNMPETGRCTAWCGCTPAP